MPPLRRKDVLPLIRAALREDAAARDVTSQAVMPHRLRIRARMIAKADGVLAGGPVAAWTFQAFDPSLRCTVKVRDGARVKPGQTMLIVKGRARSIFAAERVALNVLGHLSGIATFTHEFVRRVKPFRVQILDTRKTLPGLRALEKHAVRAGGGHSHRSDLAGAVLIKTNHLNAAREAYAVKREAHIQEAIKQSKNIAGRRFVEVEVTNMREVGAALFARPDAILLDNWRVADIRKAVALRHTLHASRFTKLEVSGNVTLSNVRAIAATGVDRISIGRLTHSAPSLDVSLRVA